MTTESLRWRDYFLRDGEQFDDFWRPFLAERERSVLFVLGHGFDTRMCDGIERILAVGGTGKRDVVLLAFHEGAESASRQHAPQRTANGERLAKLLDGRGTIEEREIAMFSEDGRRIGARSVAKAFGSPTELQAYTDVVVDISALPRGLYMPLLAKLLTMFDAEPAGKRNLHAVVSHSPATDNAILEAGLEESASYLHGFAAATFESEATSSYPKVWIPVLGKRQQPQLERIHTLVTPDEICPLLPSPAEDPREGDSLVIEYRELLFDNFRVEPRNIIYAAESNPFEVYRQLMRSVLHYDRALKPLGGCKVAVSAMSSKLASIGVVLAAYELGQRDPKVIVAVAHVESQGHHAAQEGELRVGTPTLYTVWLSGECYA